MPVFALSIHADYQCRHSGACCATDWDVPVELSVFRDLNEALASGRMKVDRPFVEGPGLPAGVTAVLRREAGACVFFQRDSHLCAVHRDLGADALPSTCRIFPRIAMTDARGTSITLSHYCPTAAAMLFRDDVPLAIVERPAAFPAAEYEGLAAGEWPPGLTPRVLMDLDAYDAWERHAVRQFATAGISPETALSTLTRDADRLQAWTPGGRSLSEAVARLPREPVEQEPAANLGAAIRAYLDVARCVPEDLRPAEPADDLDTAWRERVRPGWPGFAAPVTRYLAAHAFANWCAYQGNGLDAWMRSLEAAMSVLMVEAAKQARAAGRPLDRDLLLEALREADFLLRHLASREALAAHWSYRCL